MAKVFNGIDDQLRGWIVSQRLFFVGTAPLAGDGHVNAAPKGVHGRGEVVPGGDARFAEYQREKNAKPIDGLPALEI